MKREWSRAVRWLMPVIIASALVAGPAAAHAAAKTSCVPVATGLPFSPVPYPNIAILDDPNWLGAAKKSYSLGVPDDVAFRALTYDDGSGPKIYLSWVINHGANDLGLDDSLLFGFGTDNTTAAGKGVRFKVTFPPATAVASGLVSSTSTQVAFSTTPADPGAWDNAANAYTGPAAAWLNNGRFWTIQDPSSHGWRWVVQMTIPVDTTRTTLNTADISKGIPLATATDPLGNSYQRYFFSYVVNTSVKLPTGPAIVTSGSWPRDWTIPPEGYLMWNIPDWAEFKVNVGSCGQGVELQPMYVSTDFNDTDIHTGSDLPAQTKFRLDVHNESADTDVPVGSVEAQFQVADWGSQTFTNAEWTKVPLTTKNVGIIAKKTGANSSFEQIATTQWTPATVCLYANEWTSNTQAEINAGVGRACADNFGCPGTVCTASACTATLTPAEQAKKVKCGGVLPPDGSAARAAIKDNHQCLRAEVVGTNNIDLDVSSVYRNMNFRTASRFQEKAKISIRGLKAKSGGRDVFVWFERKNAPVEIKSGLNPDCSDTCDSEFCGTSEENVYCNYPYKDPQADVSGMPQFRAHVYYDTGVRIKGAGGKKTKVLAHQTSYGYLMAHFSTKLFGWSYAFAGPGVTPIGPDLYKVHLPNEGTVQVTNVIEAQETACLGEVSEKGQAKLKDLEKALKNAGSSYADSIKELRKDCHLPCSTLHHALEEIKLQKFDCDEVLKAVKSVEASATCACST